MRFFSPTAFNEVGGDIPAHLGRRFNKETKFDMNTDKILTSLSSIVDQSLQRSRFDAAVDVTDAGASVLMGARVFIDADAYRMAIAEVQTDTVTALSVVEHARLLDLLCEAVQHFRIDGCGYFQHWLISRFAKSETPVLYRFCVYESSRHDGAWLITQSNI